MLQQTGNILHPDLAHQPIALGVVHQIRFTLPDALMSMHARTVVAEDWLGHERDDLIMLPGDIANDVLVIHDIVRHLGERSIPHVNLTLPGSADFVVMHLDGNAYLLHLEDHLGP